MSRLRTYYYRVLSPSGRMQTGFYRLAVEQDTSVRLRLEREMDATVLSLHPLPPPLSTVYAVVSGLFSRSVNAEDLSALLRDMGVMMRAGVPVLDALATIVSERRSSGAKVVAQLAQQLYDDLDSGIAVSDAIARRPDIFPETVRNLVLIGDKSGALDRMLLEAAEHVERVTNIGRDVRTALIYPVFVFSTLLAVMAFWLVYVMPTLGELFQQLDADMPPVTLALIAFGAYASEHGLAVITGIIVVLLAVVTLFRRHEPSRKRLHAAFHYLPISKRIVTSSGMAAMTEHMAILVQSGLDIISTLNVLTRTTGDLYYRSRLQKVSEAVSRGEGVAPSMRRVGGFPPMVVRMIGVGEESGSLDEQLNHLAREYRKRLEVMIASLSEIIKPVVVLVAGGLFFFLVIALLLPIYDLIGTSMQQNMGG